MTKIAGPIAVSIAWLLCLLLSSCAGARTPIQPAVAASKPAPDDLAERERALDAREKALADREDALTKQAENLAARMKELESLQTKYMEEREAAEKVLQEEIEVVRGVSRSAEQFAPAAGVPDRTASATPADPGRTAGTPGLVPPPKPTAAAPAH